MDVFLGGNLVAGGFRFIATVEFNVGLDEIIVEGRLTELSVVDDTRCEAVV